MKKLIFSLIFVFCIGCAYNTGAIQRAERSFIQFTGNTEGVVVIIDDGNPVQLTYNKNTLYQASKGKHTLKVYRNDELVVNRVLFLDDHGTMEVIIP